METETKQKGKEMRAAIYLRVSTEDQAKEGHYGIPIQKERGKAYCKYRGYLLDENIV